MAKTKEYILRAHRNYVHKKDCINLTTPLGTIESIHKLIGEDGNVSAYIRDLIAADLKSHGIDQTGSPETDHQEPDPQDAPADNTEDLPWNNL